MTDTSVAHDQESKRYPLSFTQEWFLTMDKGDDGGPFGRRYLIVTGLRVTGPVDLAVLQSALDEVVARHDLLRTLVVRDADPAYQMVLPPCQVPLEVRDVPPVTGKSRDMVIQELMLEVHAGTISAREVPLLRALLCRFDDRDSALLMTVHHSVSDAARQPPWASIRLLGRMSVQVFSMYSRQLALESVSCATVQPRGVGWVAGHRLYWPSWFTSTR